MIYVCIDNLNALKALAGGPTNSREHLSRCPEEAEDMRLKGCRILGKWTPSHQGIEGNKIADTLAKEGLSSSSCGLTRTTLGWIKSEI